MDGAGEWPGPFAAATEGSLMEALYVEPEDIWKAEIRALIDGAEFSKDPAQDRVGHGSR